MLNWVIQENVANEERHEHLIQAVEELGDSYSLVKNIPFTTTLIPDVDPPQPVIVIGSVRLCQEIAPQRGWTTFTNNNFDFSIWREKWKDNILNEDAITGVFKNIIITNDWNKEFFIRPCKDNKAFSGTLITKDEYYDWLNRLTCGQQSSDLDFDLNEEVMIASVKDIKEEFRFFIVNNKIVTHSCYKINKQTRYFDESETNADVINFVNNMIDIWTPDKAFVMDVALVNNEYKIIEINNINSTGFYKANVFKIVKALSSMF